MTLDISYKQNYSSINELFVEIAAKGKTPILWVGAGCSKWAGYPLWNDVADIFHLKYCRLESAYNKMIAAEILAKNRYADFFKLCKDTNHSRYRALLVEIFSLRKPQPVYQRFLDAIKVIEPLWIMTTNIDELIESNVPSLNAIQASDIERCIEMRRNNQSFICKLHGTVGAIDSAIFAKDDYDVLYQRKSFLDILRQLFSDAIVIFLGTSLSEQYIIQLLADSGRAFELFGNGPHFAVLPTTNIALPENTRIIKYNPVPHQDHRTTIQVIEEVVLLRKPNKSSCKLPSIPDYKSNLNSAHMLSEITPPGTWNTSQTAALRGEDGSELFAVIGNGITTEELPISTSTAMHDIVVGLLSFDHIYTSLPSSAKLHDLLGANLFWHLVGTDCLRFIRWKSNLAINYRNIAGLQCGALQSFEIKNSDLSEIGLRASITRHINAIPGKEKEVEKLFKIMEQRTTEIDSSTEPSFADLTGGLLLRPSIRKLLGFSGGSSFNSIPQWMHFPILRLANLLKIGNTCNLLGIASTKLEYGSSALAGPSFAAASGQFLPDQMAGYVLSGSLNTDVGRIVMEDPRILDAVLRFRNSQAGANLRADIMKCLAVNNGGDFVTAVNGAMHSTIPFDSLDEARGHISGLMMACGAASHQVVPAVWNNPKYANEAIHLWKRRSYFILMEYCKNKKISDYDSCPCGSNEKLKFCCKEALSI